MQSFCDSVRVTSAVGQGTSVTLTKYFDANSEREACRRTVEENLGLAHLCARRFLGRGVVPTTCSGRGAWGL